MTDVFVEALRGTIPTEFIPPEIRSYLRRESSARLEVAKAADVELGELTIGDDCLPTWPELRWDPDTESLHAVIQGRLIDYQISRDLGDLVRRQIITQGNLQISQARALGIGIHDLSIGDNLLPVWSPVQSDVNGVHVAVEVHESDIDSETTPSQVDDFGVAPQSDVSLITPMTDVFDSHSFSMPRLGSLLSSSDVDDGDDDFDDVISLDNSLSALPVYEYGDDDSDDDEDDDDDDDVNTLENDLSALPVYADGDSVNLLHGAQLVGGPDGVLDVDLEVYLVEDGADEDIADLPEVELSIDREAFECLFGDEEAIDVEIPGTDLFCFDGLEEEASSNSDNLDDSESPHTNSLELETEDQDSSDRSEEVTERGDDDSELEASQENGNSSTDVDHGLVIEFPK